MEPALLIVADDYGYSPRTNEGVMRAAQAGAIDAVSVMVLRPWCDPAPLLAAGVAPGLHLELSRSSEPLEEPARQAEAFERLFGRPPAHIDGHHHCHADPQLAAGVAELARSLGARVRAVDDAHRTRLREAGVTTAERLVGRLRPIEPALPPDIRRHITDGAPLPPGLTEWMVHPGLPEPALRSRYREARIEDLELLLELAPNRPLLEARARGARELA